MFLAINELIKEKTRFILIISLIVLVSYLTFFLTALAFGLASSYTRAIDKWNAGGIILQRDANNNIARSLITSDDYDSLRADNIALLGVGNATIELGSKKDVAIFGYEAGSFINPNVTSGGSIDKYNDVIVSDELKKIGVSLGQEIAFKGSDLKFTVVAFTDNATFQTAPVIYMTMSTWRDLAADLAGMTGMKDDTTVNAVITKSSEYTKLTNDSKLSWQPITDYVFELPGYRPQVLTFSTMIGFLIAIASFVLAIFMYILTIQKKSMFGVLKAVGVPNSYIVRSVNIQIVILSGVGLFVGLILTLISGFALASKIPFAVQPLYFIGITFAFIVFAIIGGIASVRAVTKIDPAEAIS